MDGLNRSAGADEATITARHEHLSSLGLLDERSRRLFAALEARSVARGGVTTVARTMGISESTVRRGLRELTLAAPPPGRIRRPGAGRPPIAQREPGLVDDLDKLIDPARDRTCESPLRWTCQSGTKLAAALRERGHRVTDRTVLRLLKVNGYSLQANRKSGDGARHPDRNAQFEYVSRAAAEAIGAGQPVLGVTMTRRDAGRCRQVAITGEIGRLAASTILAWWERFGRRRYPTAASLMLVADCRGSSADPGGSWDRQLQIAADRSGLELMVCHFPPGTTRWLGVEQRVRSFVGPANASRSHEVAIDVVGHPAPARPVPACTSIETPRRGPEAGGSVPATVNVALSPDHTDWNYRLKPSVIKS